MIQGALRTDIRARAAYSEAAGIYRIIPSAVAVPHDIGEVRALVRWVKETGAPLIPRGAGSAMGGGNVGDGVIIDLTALGPKVLDVDPGRREARTSAGVTCQALSLAADPHGLRLPPDPSSGKWATLGGMLSTNAAGARTVRYGSVRSWVEAVSYVDGEGDLVTLTRGEAQPTALSTLIDRLRSHTNAITRHFPKTRKNSAGYALDAAIESGDAIDLLIGAEGTLGIITEIVWRLDAIPTERASVRITLDDLEHLGDTVKRLLVHQPSAVELMDRSFLDLVAPTLPPDVATAIGQAAAVLLVEFERSDRSELTHLLARVQHELRVLASDVTVATSSSEQSALWALRHAASPILAGLADDRRSLQVIEDGCVPIAQLATYVRAVRSITAKHRVDAVLFGHAGDGHVHVNLLPRLDEPDWPVRVRAIYDEVANAIIALGGTPAGEHGDGRLRAPLLRRVYGDDVMALFADVKRTFDPHGVFNPGIILPTDDADPISHLKTGADTVAIPDDIASALRTIEQTGGYAMPRLQIADRA